MTESPGGYSGGRVETMVREAAHTHVFVSDWNIVCYGTIPVFCTASLTRINMASFSS
jgi:hypothetical protein